MPGLLRRPGGLQLADGQHAGLGGLEVHRVGERDRDQHAARLSRLTRRLTRGCRPTRLDRLARRGRWDRWGGWGRLSRPDGRRRQAPQPGRRAADERGSASRPVTQLGRDAADQRPLHRDARVAAHQRAHCGLLRGDPCRRGVGPPGAGQPEQDRPHPVVPLGVQPLPGRRADVAVTEVSDRRGPQFGEPRVHPAGEGEERVPLAVPQTPDQVTALLPHRRAREGPLQQLLERGRVRRRVRGVGGGHDGQQPRLGARRRGGQLVQRDHFAGVAVEAAALRELLGEFLVRTEVAAVGDDQMAVRARGRDLGGLAPVPSAGGRPPAVARQGTRRGRSGRRSSGRSRSQGRRGRRRTAWPAQAHAPRRARRRWSGRRGTSGRGPVRPGRSLPRDADHRDRGGLGGHQGVLHDRGARRGPQPVVLEDLEQHDAEHHERHFLRHALPPPDRERDERVPRPVHNPVRFEPRRVERVRLGPPVARITLRGERADQDDVALADPVAPEHPVLKAAPDRDRLRRVDAQGLLDHLGDVRQRQQVVVLQVVVRVAAGDPVDLGQHLLLDLGVAGQDRRQPGPGDRRPVEAVRQVHEHLVADRLPVEVLAGLRVRRAHQAAEQVVLRAQRGGVLARPDQRVGRPHQLGVVLPVAVAPGAVGPAGQPAVRERVGDPADALLGALQHRLGERGRAGVAVEQAEVVVAGAAAGHLERVTLHPDPGVHRLLVGQRGPVRDQAAGLLLHQLQLGALVLGRVPGQHDPADHLGARAVADHRDTAAAGVAQLGEEVDLLGPLAELLLVAGHLVEQIRVGDHHQTPLLGGHADRVDVPELAVVLQLAVVVVEDAEVREPLALGHQPADRVADLQRAVGVGLRRDGPRARLSRARRRRRGHAGCSRAGCAGQRGHGRGRCCRRRRGGGPGWLGRRWCEWCAIFMEYGNCGGGRRGLDGCRRVVDLQEVLPGQPEHARADADDVALGQPCFLDPLPVHVRAVGAAQVHDPQVGPVAVQLGVVPRGAGVRDHDVALRRPPDPHDLRDGRLGRRRPASAAGPGPARG